jgi:omega-hydroxy-beta-dihydromenaquinone-9 sulfotransferase
MRPDATSGPIFIVGYMHSGTTLLLNVLGRHPDVFAPDHETKFFSDRELFLRHIRSRGGELDAAARGLVMELVRSGFPRSTPRGRPAQMSSLAYAHAFRAAMDDLTRASGGARWVEKTPMHVFHATEIWSGIPDARFVEIVRDPRDVLASKKTRKLTVWTSSRYRPEDRPRKDLEKSYDPLWDTLSWISAVRAGQAAARVRPEQWASIRYEDLVGDPAAVVADLCRSLGLAYSNDLLDVDRGIPADPDTADQDRRGVSMASYGRFEDVLDPVEVAICERVSRDELARLGYEPLSGVAARRILGRIIARSIPALVTRLAARVRMGGFTYLMAVVRGYLRRIRRL